MSSSARAWSCEVCGKRVSRLLGMAGAVEVAGGATRVLPVVRGYCAQHRSAVMGGFQGELAGQGTLVWLSEPEVELKPRDAEGFLRHADLALGSFRPEGAPARGGQSSECPQCGSCVDWGRGPHLADAAVRRNAVAWACRTCDAAGLAYPAM